MTDALNISIGGENFCPPIGTPAFQNHVVDLNTEGVAWAFQSRAAEAITHVGFRYGARTGTPPVYRISLQSLAAASGFPDTTVLGGGTPASVLFTPPADTTWDGLWQWLALDNAYTPTRGQILCLVIEYSSGTIDVSNNSSFTARASNILEFYGFPYSLTNTSGTWTRLSTGIPVHGIRTATTRYGFPIEAFYNTRSASTVGHRQACVITLPAGWGDTHKIKGIEICASLSAAVGKNPVIGLWNAAGVIQDITWDSEFSASATTGFRHYRIYFDEVTLTAINYGTKVYVGLEVADAANGGVILNGMQLDSTTDLLAFPGGASILFGTFDGSTWTEDNTVRPFARLILDDITEPAGSGGPVSGNMRGGFVN